MLTLYFLFLGSYCWFGEIKSRPHIDTVSSVLCFALITSFDSKLGLAAVIEIILLLLCSHFQVYIVSMFFPRYRPLVSQAGLIRDVAVVVLILVSPPSECRDYTDAPPCLDCAVLGTECWAQYMLGRHSVK